MSLREDNIDWHLRDGEEPRLLKVLSGHTDGFEVVKDNKARTVWALEAEGKRLYMKRYKLSGTAEKMKNSILPSKARVEYDAANTLISKGIPTTIPVAYGEKRKGGLLRGAWLVTEEISGVRPLIECLPEMEGEERGAALEKLAALAATLHENGVYHRDFHCGNVLVRRVAGKPPELYVIDLHRISFLKEMPYEKRVNNLAHLLYSVYAMMSPEERRSVIENYSIACGGDGGDSAGALFGDVEKRIKGVRRRHMRSRTERCLKDSTGFDVVAKGEERCFVRKGRSYEDVKTLIAKHMELEEKGASALVKKDRYVTASIVSGEGGGGGEFFVKRYINKGVRDLLSASRARKGWVGANGLVVRGVATPPPVACVERKGESFLITEKADALEMDRFLIKNFGP
ncbi:MAG: lipopolysaccharide kinase InaA family protein, partial [Thermodesulfobacteriota bacterium]